MRGIEDAPLATAVFVLLFAAVIAVFFVFPERQVDKLLLPIPDEDDEGVASADASEVSAVEGEEATAAEHRGRWKQLCMQLEKRKCWSCWRAATGRSRFPMR